MLSRKTMLSLVFKLIQTAQGNWKKIRGFVRLAEVIRGVKFTDGFTNEEIKSFEDVKHAA